MSFSMSNQYRIDVILEEVHEWRTIFDGRVSKFNDRQFHTIRFLWLIYAYLGESYSATQTSNSEIVFFFGFEGKMIITQCNLLIYVFFLSPYSATWSASNEIGSKIKLINFLCTCFCIIHQKFYNFVCLFVMLMRFALFSPIIILRSMDVPVKQQVGGRECEFLSLMDLCKSKI